MKKLLSFILAMTVCVTAAVSVGAVVDHGLICEYTAKNSFSYSTDKDIYAPGDYVTVTVYANSFWGDPELTAEDADLGEVKGAYGVSIFTVSPVFDTAVFEAKRAPKLVTASTVMNGDSMTTVAPTAVTMNKWGVAPVMITPASIITENGDGYVTFYGSGDIYTITFAVKEGVSTGEYPIYFGNYINGNGDGNDITVNGVSVDLNPNVDPYGTAISDEYNDYGAPLMISVISPDDLPSVYGDVNGDTRVNLRDVSILMKKLNGFGETQCSGAAADMDRNGKLELYDAVCIMKIVAKWDSAPASGKE